MNVYMDVNQVLLLENADTQSSGAKATACGRLASLAAASTKGKACIHFFSQSERKHRRKNIHALS